MRAPSVHHILYLAAAGGFSGGVLFLSWQRADLAQLYRVEIQAEAARPTCRDLNGGDDVLMVMKTGATELQDKLSIHLRTTLTCYPHYLIFSSYEEHLESGQHVLDALRYVSPSIQESHEDFDLWRKLQSNNGRAGLQESELSGADSRYKDEDVRMQIPAWRLDKWKFLPMVNQTWHHSPDKSWYVFVEADTYVLWSSLLRYLDGLPRTEDLYLGAWTGIEDVVFAHGGSGFILSRSALEKVATLFSSSQGEWEEFTDRYWAGDHILGAALRAAGVNMQPSDPSLQGEPIGSFDFRSDAWCDAAISYHHESPPDIEDLWTSEQQWIAAAMDQSDPDSTLSWEPQLLRHRDIFEKYVLPRTRDPRLGWDNFSDVPKSAVPVSLNECRDLCEKEPDCLQYSLREGGDCSTTTRMFLGQAAEGIDSGWMPERLQQLLADKGEC